MVCAVRALLVPQDSNLNRQSRPATAACDLWSIPFSITSSDSIQSEACASPKLLGFIDNSSKAALQTSRHAIFSRLPCRLRPFRPPFGQLFHFFQHSPATVFSLPTACLPVNHTPLQPTSNRPSHRIASRIQPLRIGQAQPLANFGRIAILGLADPSTATIVHVLPVRHPPPPHRRHVCPSVDDAPPHIPSTFLGFFASPFLVLGSATLR